ncbi:MAG: radical SAM protein, partial [Candidatus Ornithomonoglobus sp.]
MNIVRMKEHSFIKKHLRCVRHVTLDPKGPGVVRIHMIPPDTSWNRAVPYILVLNGQYLLPIGVSWAIMLSCFIDRIEEAGSGVRYDVDWDAAIKKTVADTRKIYPAMTSANIRKELVKLLDTARCVARGEEPDGDIKVITIGEYAPHMTSPHRMDLMISAMTKDGAWHCNQRCLHCYAANQAGAEVRELDTEGYKRVI